MDEVLEFISRRWKKDSNFIDGNCYWFAHILCTRFPYLRMYYLPIEGHFVAGTPSRYYDWTGLNSSKEKPVVFDEIKVIDSSWYNRIVRDCVD